MSDEIEDYFREEARNGESVTISKREPAPFYRISHIPALLPVADLQLGIDQTELNGKVNQFDGCIDA